MVKTLSASLCVSTPASHPPLLYAPPPITVIALAKSVRSGRWRGKKSCRSA
nr:MAG TPA_asm: hypothetical protein [Caudoviricetes sp.]